MFVTIYALSSGTGFNRANQQEDYTKNEYFCGVENAQYMLYGSICTFYIPCAIIVATYL
jgi:hypothetical protein